MAGSKKHNDSPGETEIRGQLREFLEWQGWFVFYHLQGLGSYPGLPDLQAVKGGRTLYIEVKRPGGRQSPRQLKFQQELEAAGGTYILARCLEDLYVGPRPACTGQRPGRGDCE